MSAINISTFHIWSQQVLQWCKCKAYKKVEENQLNLIKLQCNFTLILFQIKPPSIDLFLFIRTSLELLQRNNSSSYLLTLSPCVLITGVELGQNMFLVDEQGMQMQSGRFLAPFGPRSQISCLLSGPLSTFLVWVQGATT